MPGESKKVDYRGIRLTKKKIRSRLLLGLRKQKEEERSKKSALIKKKLFGTGIFKKAKVVMFYIAFDGEVNTQEMIKETQMLGKTVVVPVCGKDRTMRPCLLKTRFRLKKGLYGIGEPTEKKFVGLDRIDLVLVPGLAFDKTGNRLGRGKGYYDRFLKVLPENKTCIGLAYDFQILRTLPTTPLDMAVQRTIFA